MPRYTTAVAHELGKEEALARLKTAVAQAGASVDLQGDWDGDTFDFSLTAQGLRVVARVTVEEDRLTFNGTLPLLAMPFKSWIARALKKSLQQRPEPAPVLPDDTPEPPEPTEPVVLFLHIPKAGGQTLGEFIDFHTRDEKAGGADTDLLRAGVAYLTYGFFKEQPLAIPEHVLALLRRRDLRAVLGHFWFGLHEHVARPSVYVTMLRDPVERVVSLYSYARLHETMSLDEFVAEPPFREVDNDQTRRIAGVDPAIGECTPAMLHAAQENLRRHFAVVGTIERLDETLALLRQRLGWQRPMAAVHPRNVNPERPAVASLPAATVAAIRRRNELDLELCRYASELLDEARA